MNKFIAMGRLTKDPQIIYPSTPEGKKTARYTIAIDRRYRNADTPTADFIPCVAFGTHAEFAEKYLHQGIKIIVNGRIQTDSYEKDGGKVYTWNLIIEEQEFAESKSANENINRSSGTAIEDEGLPFN